MIRMAAFVATLAALSAAVGPALALSCLPPDAVRYFTQARDAEETYMVVHGAFTLDPNAPPMVVESGETTEGFTEWRGQLRGQSLGPKGFNLPFNAEIRLNAACIGSWCVFDPPEGRLLAFVELAEDGPVLKTDTCSTWMIREPSRAQLRAVVQCQGGGACETAN